MEAIAACGLALSQARLLFGGSRLDSSHTIVGPTQGSRWDDMRRYGIPALLWSAWIHTATSFWLTAIPVCCRLLNSCKIYCLLCSARNLVSWLSGKSLKLLCPEWFHKLKICQKMPLLRTRLGSLQHCPDALAGFIVPTSKGRRGQGSRGEAKGKGVGGGKGHTGTFFPLQALGNVPSNFFHSVHGKSRCISTEHRGVKPEQKDSPCIEQPY